jgi:hypothetical protein
MWRKTVGGAAAGGNCPIGTAVVADRQRPREPGGGTASVHY